MMHSNALLSTTLPLTSGAAAVAEWLLCEQPMAGEEKLLLVDGCSGGSRSAVFAEMLFRLLIPVFLQK
jgi:hypothetical protein